MINASIMNERDRTSIERISEELKYIKTVASKTSREEFLYLDIYFEKHL